MQNCDVLVVGAGLGGITAAALLVKKKKRTIVIDRGESLNHSLGTCELDGFSFSTMPSLFYGMDEKSVVHAIMENFNIAHSDFKRSSCYQIALPDRRITIYADLNETVEQLRREFPKEITSLERFYQDLRKESTRNAKSRLARFISRHRQAGGFVRKYRFSRELIAFYNVQSQFFFQKEMQDISLYHLINMCENRPYHVRNGFNRIASSMRSYIEQQSEAIRYNHAPLEYIYKHNRIVGVHTTHGTIHANFVLENKIDKQLSRFMFLGVRDDVIPVSMCQEVIVLPDYSQPLNIIHLSLSDGMDRSSAPEGHRALTATFRSPVRSEENKNVLISHIDRIMPFIRDFTVVADEYDRFAVSQEKDTIIPDSKEVQFKPYKRQQKESLLYRGSKKKIFRIVNRMDYPVQVMSDASTFVSAEM